tara:strand:+ start:484 stop:927 length:444 start_codon:yes stop_codon:yes gene_type:complete
MKSIFPIEIETKIMELYWMDIFKNNIIVFLEKISSKIETIIDFCDLYFLPSREEYERYDHIFIDFLVASNEILRNININNGLKKYFKNRYKEYKFILIEEPYLSNDTKILKKLHYIALFIISRSGQMRYYTYERFAKLSNTFKNIEI